MTCCALGDRDDQHAFLGRSPRGEIAFPRSANRTPSRRSCRLAAWDAILRSITNNSACRVGTFRKLELRSCLARLHLEPKVEPMLFQSTLVCPHCSVAKTETMPTDACQFFYECTGCGKKLKAKPGDCCVFCSFGSVPCPPVQAERSGEHGSAACCPGTAH